MKKYMMMAMAAWMAVQTAAAQDFHMDWAYHGRVGGDPAAEQVPGGEGKTFFSPAGTVVADAESVTLYVLTDHQFAGDMEEQVYVRWWDGYMAHWIMGTWVQNITVQSAAPFHGQPADGDVMLDLWAVTIPDWITQPGENYYAIQLKAYSGQMTDERYLLARSRGDFSRTNRLGQVWSSSEEFDGQDWQITIQP